MPDEPLEPEEPEEPGKPANPPEDPASRGAGRRHAFRPWRHRGRDTSARRWQPTPLGLVGVTIGVMAITLLLIQAIGGDMRFGGGTPETGPTAVDATPPSGTARVMVAGDSLVQGSTGDYTWRYRLWRHLNRETDAGVEFVGPHDDLFSVHSALSGDSAGERDHHYAEPEFDRAHAGVWGATIGMLSADIGTYVAEFEPHYLLVMVGINDLLAGSSPEETLESLRDLVGVARVGDSGLQIVLGELTPVWGTGQDQPLNEAIAEYNAGLPVLAGQLTSPDSPVTVARTAADYAPADHNWDPVHPNARGELRIAAAFADTLAEALNLGEPYPRPLPDVEVGPRTAPVVEAETTGGTVRLTWDPVPGATHYRVWQRRSDPDPDQLVQVGSDIPGSTVKRPRAEVGDLLNGATYTFYVEPVKGGDAGLRSEALEVTIQESPPPAPEWVRVSEDSDTPTLTWARVPSATHYAVWRRAMDCSPPESPEESPRCVPVDEEEPGEGEGWEAVAVVNDQERWSPETEGTTGYEFAVRSHHDYVEGEISRPVPHSGDG